MQESINAFLTKIRPEDILSLITIVVVSLSIAISSIYSINKLSNENIIKYKNESYSKKEVDSMIQKTKSQTEQKTKEIVKKELSKTQAVEPTQVVYVKPRPDVIDEDELISKQLLSFLKIEFNDNKLIIHTDHEVSKKFSIIKENKIIIDYKAKINFLTKKDDIDSRNYKKITIGNHKNEGYFRVAIELIDKPSKYDVKYESNLITISKIN